MDTKLEKKLDRIIELLEGIRTEVEETQFVKSAVDDVETVAKRILKHLQQKDGA